MKAEEIAAEIVHDHNYSPYTIEWHIAEAIRPLLQIKAAARAYLNDQNEITREDLRLALEQAGRAA